MTNRELDQSVEQVKRLDREALIEAAQAAESEDWANDIGARIEFNILAADAGYDFEAEIDPNNPQKLYDIVTSDPETEELRKVRACIYNPFYDSDEDRVLAQVLYGEDFEQTTVVDLELLQELNFRESPVEAAENVTSYDNNRESDAAVVEESNDEVVDVEHEVDRSQIGDLVNIDANGRGHRPDGKFLSKYEMDMIATHQDQIRGKEASQVIITKIGGQEDPFGGKTIVELQNELSSEDTEALREAEGISFQQWHNTGGLAGYIRRVRAGEVLPAKATKEDGTKMSAEPNDEFDTASSTDVQRTAAEGNSSIVDDRSAPQDNESDSGEKYTSEEIIGFLKPLIAQIQYQPGTISDATEHLNHINSLLGELQLKMGTDEESVINIPRIDGSTTSGRIIQPRIIDGSVIFRALYKDGDEIGEKDVSIEDLIAANVPTTETDSRETEDDTGDDDQTTTRPVSDNTTPANDETTTGFLSRLRGRVALGTAAVVAAVSVLAGVNAVDSNPESSTQTATAAQNESDDQIEDDQVYSDDVIDAATGGSASADSSAEEPQIKDAKTIDALAGSSGTTEQQPATTNQDTAAITLTIPSNETDPGNGNVWDQVERAVNNGNFLADNAQKQVIVARVVNALQERLGSLDIVQPGQQIEITQADLEAAGVDSSNWTLAA